MAELVHHLRTAFPDLTFDTNVPLAPFTAIKIGGLADILTRVDTTDQLARLVKHCQSEALPFTVLGWGANTLIADAGLRGLVIRNMTKALIVEPLTEPVAVPATPPHRHHAIEPHTDFGPLDYDEGPDAPRVRVTAASGWPIASLMATLLAQEVTGLQWYARIPATLGGAIVNNIHGGTHFISEVVDTVRVVTPDNQEQTLNRDECAYDYDYSRFHESGETILDAQLILWKGDAVRARTTVAEWARRKQLQPQRSLGCVFQNITPEQQKRLQLPTTSVGYLIDQVLGLKGKRSGDAIISEKHAAFIENLGQATADDYLKLALEIWHTAKAKYGIELKPEIFFKGFTSSELQELAHHFHPSVSP